MQHSIVQRVHVLCCRTNLRQHIFLHRQSVRHQLSVFNCEWRWILDRVLCVFCFKHTNDIVLKHH